MPKTRLSIRMAFAGLIALGALLPLAGGETYAGAGAPSIGGLQVLTSSVQLTSISCIDADTCYVIGDNGSGTPSGGTVFTLVDGAVTSQQSLGQADTGDWKDIACSSSETCYAIGTDAARPAHAVIAPIVNGTSGSAQTLPAGVLLGAGVASGIACGSGATCYGGGVSGNSGTGVLVPIVNGQIGSPISVPGTSYLFDDDCPTTDICYAVSTDGVASIQDGQPGNVQPVPPPANGSPNLTAIACPSSNACDAAGSLAGNSPHSPGVGAVVAVVNGQPGPLQTVAGANWLYALACPTSHTCFALGTGTGATSSEGIVVPVIDGVGGAAIPVDLGAPAAQSGFVGGDCPSSHLCYALFATGIVPITPAP